MNYEKTVIMITKEQAFSELHYKNYNMQAIIHPHIPDVIGIGYINYSSPCNMVWVSQLMTRDVKFFMVGFHRPKTDYFHGIKTQNYRHGMNYNMQI